MRRYTGCLSLCFAGYLDRVRPCTPPLRKVLSYDKQMPADMAKEILTFKLTKTVDGVPKGEPELEQYTLKESTDKEIILVPEGTGTVLRIRMDIMEAVGKETVNGIETTKYGISKMIGFAGGNEEVYLDDDRNVIKDVKTQMWSLGVLYKEYRELVTKTV